MILAEPLENLFISSKLLILDFDQISKTISKEENVEKYFNDCQSHGINPRLPQNRQKFNNNMLAKTNKRYLVSRYGEDRRSMLVGTPIAKEKRTIHLGIDIFSKDLEPVFAPCDGRILRTGYEKGDASFGHYIIIQPSENPEIFIFLGHLSKNLPPLGSVNKNQVIASLGDYKNNENGGWSRHLHLQILSNLPDKDETPIGYSTLKNFPGNSQKFPDPMKYFKGWKLA